MVVIVREFIVYDHDSVKLVFNAKKWKYRPI